MSAKMSVMGVFTDFKISGLAFQVRAIGTSQIGVLDFDLMYYSIHYKRPAHYRWQV